MVLFEIFCNPLKERSPFLLLVIVNINNICRHFILRVLSLLFRYYCYYFVIHNQTFDHGLRLFTVDFLEIGKRKNVI